MDLGGLGSSSSSMQVSVDEYRSITYIPKTTVLNSISGFPAMMI